MPATTGRPLKRGRGLKRVVLADPSDGREAPAHTRARIETESRLQAYMRLRSPAHTRARIESRGPLVFSIRHCRTLIRWRGLKHAQLARRAPLRSRQLTRGRGLKRGAVALTERVRVAHSH